MPLKIIPYVRGSELGDIIKKIKARADDKNNKNQAVIKFIVPSRKDRPWWSERADCEFYAPCQPREVPWTWQELYEDICNFSAQEAHSVISPPDHLLILRKILHNILKERPELANLWPGIKRPGFLDILSDDIHELLNEGVAPEQLDAQGQPENSDDKNDVSMLLHRAYADYLEYLENNSLIDAAQIWTAAFKLLSKNTDWGRKYILVFTGFMSFTSGQLELVNLLKSRSQELIIIRPEANLKNFRDAISQLMDVKNLENNLDFNAVKILETPAAEAGLEPEALARNLSLWASGKGDFADNNKNKIKFTGFGSIGIMSPSGMENAVAEAMRRYHVPYYFNSGVIISQTLVGRILASIRALNNLLFPNYETAMLLTQPCFAGSEFSVFRAFRAGASGLEGWRKYLENLTMSESGEADRPINEIALNAIKNIEKFCNAVKTGGTPEELMTAFYEFLTAKGLWLDRMRLNDIGADFDESLRLVASAIETVSDKILALHEKMPNIGEVSENILKDGDAFDFLEMWCRESFTNPPVKINGAVSIYSGQPPVLASYPVWIMLNVTQRVWPGRIQSSPLLSASDRENIALNGAYLPTVQDKATQREALFRRLILTGENLTVISRPEVDDENRPMSESPFMRRFMEDMRCDRKILKTSSIKILTGDKNYIFDEIEPAADIFNKKIMPVITDMNIKSFGASDLGEILSCPFLWWLNRSADIHERKLELATPAQWGMLAHSMWEKIWRNFKVNLNNLNNKNPEELFIELTKQELEKFLAFDENFDENNEDNENNKNNGENNKNGDDYAEYRRFARDFRLRRGLENFKFRFLRLGGVQGRILGRIYKNGLRHCNIWLENEARLNLQSKLLKDENIYFSGQCDRIEVFIGDAGEKLAVITDYKRGRSANYESKTKINFNGQEIEFKFGLQLSAYALMFAQQHPEIKLAGVNFLGLEDGKLAGTFDGSIRDLFIEDSAEPKKLASPISEREEEAEMAVKCAADIIKGGKFAPDYSSKWCKKCGMKGICRRSEFIGEKLSELDNNNFDAETANLESE